MFDFQRPKRSEMVAAGMGRRQILLGGVAASMATCVSQAVEASTIFSPGLANVLVFGADATGKADSAPALQAAANSLTGLTGGTVYIPAGTYRLGSPIVLPSKSVTLMGDGANTSILAISHTGIGVIFAPTTNYTKFVIRDLGFSSVSSTPSQCAISAQFPSGQVPCSPSCDFANVDTGIMLPGSLGFIGALSLSNIWRSVFHNMSHHGPGASVLGSYFATIGGFSIDPRFEDCTIDQVDIAFKYTSYTEGTHLINPIIAGVNTGLSTGSTPYRGSINLLGLYITGGEIACLNTALNLFQVWGAYISDSHFCSTTNGPVCALLGCLSVEIHDSQISGSPQATVGVALSTTSSAGCADNTISGITFMNLNTAIVFNQGVGPNNAFKLRMVDPNHFPLLQTANVAIDMNGNGSLNNAEWITSSTGTARYAYLR